MIILVGLTLWRKLDIDMMQQLKASVERLQDGNMVADGPPQERGDVMEQVVARGRSFEVDVETLLLLATK